MNQVSIIGKVTHTYFVGKNYHVRVGILRSLARPRRADGGRIDYVTLVFLGGSRTGVRIPKDTVIWATGFLRHREYEETLADTLETALKRGEGSAEDKERVRSFLESIDETAKRIKRRRVTTEVVVEDWGLVPPEGLATWEELEGIATKHDAK